jgi:hypothetical protein
MRVCVCACVRVYYPTQRIPASPPNGRAVILKHQVANRLKLSCVHGKLDIGPALRVVARGRASAVFSFCRSSELTASVKQRLASTDERICYLYMLLCCWVDGPVRVSRRSKAKCDCDLPVIP